MFPPKPFYCSEGLDAFRFFFINIGGMDKISSQCSQIGSTAKYRDKSTVIVYHMYVGYVCIITPIQ